MNFTLYKKAHNLPHLNPSIATFIVTYCLGKMTNDNLKFDDWHVGITNNQTNDEKYVFQECASHLEALQTQSYLLNEKGMINDNKEISGNETVIYVYRA